MTLAPKPPPVVLIGGDKSVVEPGEYNAWANPGHAPDDVLCCARAATPGEAIALVCEMLAEDFRKADSPTPNEIDADGAIHGAFGLSYAHYLVWPRSLMQAMPAPWQGRFVALWNEYTEAYPGHRAEYLVKRRGEHGRFVADPLADYRRPDRGAIAEARR